MAVKAVIDTNIWVSALLNPFGFPARLRKSFEEGIFKDDDIKFDKEVLAFLSEYEISATSVANFLKLIEIF